METKKQRVGDDLYWIEVIRDDEGGHIRGPVGVIEQLIRWATRWGYCPRQHLKATTEEEGEVKVMRLSGTPAEMKKFVEATKMGAPGRVERLVSAIDNQGE
jgi:hypothetical protein